MPKVQDTAEANEAQARVVAEKAAAFQKNKAKILKQVHEGLRRLRYDQRVNLIERFHQNIIDHAKEMRAIAKIPRVHAASIEAQVAAQRNAIKYEGLWVQTYLGDIPVLIVETIEVMKKDVKWAKDRP